MMFSKQIITKIIEDSAICMYMTDDVVVIVVKGK